MDVTEVATVADIAKTKETSSKKLWVRIVIIAAIAVVIAGIFIFKVVNKNDEVAVPKAIATAS